MGGRSTTLGEGAGIVEADFRKMIFLEPLKKSVKYELSVF